MTSRLRIISLVALITLLNSPVGHGQANKRESAVVVPRETVLFASAYQPDCPLRLDSADMLGYVEGGGVPLLKLKHLGSKPIKSYDIALLGPDGTGWQWAFSKNRIMPGETIVVSEKPSTTNIISITEDLRKKLELTGGTKGIVILFVVRIEYLDGTVFDDSKVFQSLKKYFEK